MLLPSALGFSPHPPVSVYGTGTLQTIAAFPGSKLISFPTKISVLITSLRCMADLPFRRLLRLDRSLHSRLGLSLCVPTFLIIRSAGIYTSCPSTTPSGLALGPDLPRADQLYPGNLGYSAWRILTSISLLIPAFSLHNTPRLLIGTASSLIQCSSTNHLRDSLASVTCLSPGHFRRRTSRLVSYYALFECVAASEPTS